MEIRYANVKDEQSIINLISQFPEAQSELWDTQASAKAFRKIVHNSDLGTILVAEEDNEVLGVLTLSYPTAVRCGGLYTCIEEFIVDEKGRGKGIGGGLLKAALNEAKSKGCFELQVNNPSTLGYPVYLKYGLKDIGKHLKILLSVNED
jgi:predicted N-acetyltransferase YhbS